MITLRQTTTLQNLKWIWAQIIKIWLSQQPIKGHTNVILNPTAKTKNQFSLGKSTGKSRGNLKCGSAQPSLFHVFAQRDQIAGPFSMLDILSPAWFTCSTWYAWYS